MSYIIVAKPSDHTHMMNIIELSQAAEGESFETTDTDGLRRYYRFINQVPLNASHPDFSIIT